MRPLLNLNRRILSVILFTALAAGLYFLVDQQKSDVAQKQTVEKSSTSIKEAEVVPTGESEEAPPPIASSNTPPEINDPSLATRSAQTSTPKVGAAILPDPNQEAERGKAVSGHDPLKPKELELDIVANQVMMSFSDSFKSYSREEKDALLEPFGVKIVKEFKYAGNSVLLEITGAPRSEAGKLPVGETKESVYKRVNDVIEQLQRSGFVRYAEPDAVVQTTSVPNDPRYNELWGLQKIQAEQAWDYVEQNNPNPSEIVVGVIDTGVDYTHPDLAANMWVNTAEVPGDGIDNDNNGYIDDIYGWDAINDDGDPMDDNYHGTHVAGTIGAVRDNNEGIVGVTPYVKIMALKFLGANGIGFSSDAVELLNYVHLMKQEHNVDVRLTNNSWGGGGFHQAMQEAISSSNEQDILFIAAAGNAALNTDNIPNYPSDYDIDNVISVAATDINDDLAWFSNFGSQSVDIAAPGVSILSTYSNGSYNAINGTSMAAPHVSGVAALTLALEPNLSVSAVKDKILNGADVLETLSNKVLTSARLNAYQTFLPDLFDIDLVNDELLIPEGASVDVNIRLTRQPESPSLTAAVIKNSGDTDIQLASGESLIFTSSNWDQWQPITLFAQQDEDGINNNALITVAAAGFKSSSFKVIEQDDEPLSIVCDNVSEIPTSECQDLAALYSATGGENWYNNTGWFETAEPCSWYGVTCGSSSIETLDLPNNNLEGSIPSELANLINLTYINFKNNKLTGNIPSQFGNLTNIWVIDLSFNRLTGNIPSSLGNIPNMFRLYLDQNQLTGSIPSSFGNFTNLTELTIGGNELTGVIPSSMAQLNRLDTLILYHNQFSADVMTNIGNFTNLSELNLSSNKISGPIPAEIGNLVNLGVLALSYNKLEGEIPSTIVNLQRIGAGIGILRLDRNALESSDDSTRAYLNTANPDWEDTQTVPPTDLNFSVVDDQMILSWMPITFSSGYGEYVISYSDSVDGPYLEYGRTESKVSSSHIINDFTTYPDRFYVVQAYTPSGDGIKPFQQNDIISRYSDPVQADLSTVTPIVILPAPLTIDASSADGISINYPLVSQFLSAVSAHDPTYGATNNITHDAPLLFPEGITPVTFTACNSLGVCSSSTQTVTVNYDPVSPAPVVTAPADKIAEATGLTTIVDLGIATATDAVDGTLTATANQTGPFTIGVHTITWRAVNSTGKEGLAVQQITVQDTTAPAITASNIVIEATGALTSVDVTAATAVDLVDGNITPASDQSLPLAPLAIGTHTINWTATDAAGNTSTATQTVTVQDTTAPTITVPGPILLESTGEFTPVTLGWAIAVDLVDGNIAVSPDNLGPFAVGEHTVTWSSTDLSNNTGIATQLVNIVPLDDGGWIHCVQEWGYCTLPVPAVVRYGINGNYVYQQRDEGTFYCGNSTFGNPDPTLRKYCHYLLSDTIDFDGDGVVDSQDAFPADDDETTDTDGDGIGDKSDPFPDDPTNAENANWIHCAQEWGYCALPVPSVVRYGSNGKYVYQRRNQAIFYCGNSVFGDPDPSIRKDCDYLLYDDVDFDGDGVADSLDAFPTDDNETIDSDTDGFGDKSDPFPNDPTNNASDNWVFCVGEFGTCDVPLPTWVRYGLNGQYFYKHVNDSVACRNHVFGNPINVRKQCDYLLSHNIDADGDGVMDSQDAFPNDINESVDTDGDGIGDNADIFLNDPNNGVGDAGWNWCSNEFGVCTTPIPAVVRFGDGSNYAYMSVDAGEAVACRTTTFGDPALGVLKHCDYYLSDQRDYDGDGVFDRVDAFPSDNSETTDSDGDRIGDNTDPFPSDPTNRAITNPNPWVACANEFATCAVPSIASVRYGANGELITLEGVTGSLSCINSTFGNDPAPGIPKACEYRLESFSMTETASTTSEDSQFNGGNPQRIRSELIGSPSYLSLLSVRKNLAGADVSIDYMVHEPLASPQGLVVLIAGGDLDAELAVDGSNTLTSAGDDFLVRGAHLFAAQGYKVVTINHPSDQADDMGAGTDAYLYDTYRGSMRHAVDVSTIIHAENTSDLPVFISGVDRGVISAMALNSMVDGIDMASAVTTGSGTPVHSNHFDLTSLIDNIHLSQHMDDGCGVSLPTESQNRYDDLVSAGGRVLAHRFYGGFNDPAQTDLCQPNTLHGYFGIESSVVERTAQWYDSLLVRFLAPRPTADPVTLVAGTTTVDLSVLTTGEEDLFYSLPYAQTSLGGTLLLVDGVVTYTPPANTASTEDSFVYVVRSSNGRVNHNVIKISLQ